MIRYLVITLLSLGLAALLLHLTRDIDQHLWLDLSMLGLAQLLLAASGGFLLAEAQLAWSAAFTPQARGIVVVQTLVRLGLYAGLVVGGKHFIKDAPVIVFPAFIAAICLARFGWDIGAAKS